MSLLWKILSSIKIGAARVDAAVSNPQVLPGQELTGRVMMKGGAIEQEIGALRLELSINYYVQGGGSTESERAYVLSETGIYQPFVLARKEVREVPFALPVPLDCPITAQRSQVWLATRMDIAMALDPEDHDPLEVLPLPLMSVALEAMELLGLQRTVAWSEWVERLNRDRPFVQIFAFVPRGGPFRERCQEVELIFYPDPHHLVLVLEIDRRLLATMAPRQASLTLTAADLSGGSRALAPRLEGLLAGVLD